MIAFSVIIPLYNKADTVRNTIESVLRQSYPHFEIIVVDDGSTDRSAETVEAISDTRIHLFRKENGGPGSARNHGIRQAQFDWSIWLDADDLMLPGALEHFASVIGERPQADMIVGNFELDDAGKTSLYHQKKLSEHVDNAFKCWFLKELMPCAGTYCCKTEILAQHPYQEKLKRSEDTDVLFRVFRKSRIVRTDFVVMRYCRDFSSESRRKTHIDQDFQGHLDFASKKSLWERICLYELYVEAKNNYPDEVSSVYPDMNWHFMLKIAYLCAFWYRALRRKLER